MSKTENQEKVLPDRLKHPGYEAWGRVLEAVVSGAGEVLVTEVIPYQAEEPKHEILGP